MKKERAIVAEFHKDSGGRLTLFSLVSIEDHGDCSDRKVYDVAHSRRYGYLFNQSGAGGGGLVQVSGIYFVSGAVEVAEGPTQLVDPADKPPWRGKKTQAIRNRNRTRRLRVLPKAFGIELGDDLLDWLQIHAIEEEAVYCSRCRDYLPGDSLCDHCWWCDKRLVLNTPSEPCGCKDRDECDGREGE